MRRWGVMVLVDEHLLPVHFRQDHKIVIPQHDGMVDLVPIGHMYGNRGPLPSGSMQEGIL